MVSKPVETCYMCDEPRYNRDHVPPQCIFPEQKDSDGVDYRKNLIRVPSCEKHNNQMSGDDQEFHVVIASHFLNNLRVQTIQQKKVVRTLRENKRLWRELVGKGFQKEGHTGVGEKIVMIKLERKNIDCYFRCADKIARGLFYHEHKYTWKHEVNICPLHLEALNHTVETFVAVKHAQQYRDKFLVRKPEKRGNNPDIFFYQELMDIVGYTSIIRLVFYEGAEIVLLFPTP